MSRALAALAAQYVGRRCELAPANGCAPRATVLRVTSRGFTVRLDGSGATVAGVTTEEVSRWID